MDRKELENSLIDFKNKCAEIHKPIKDLTFVEAYPGDSSTSYIVQVKADWIDDLSASEVLDSLINVLWDTTTQDIRRNIFAIKILENKKELELEEVN